MCDVTAQRLQVIAGTLSQLLMLFSIESKMKDYNLYLSTFPLKFCVSSGEFILKFYSTTCYNFNSEFT